MYKMRKVHYSMSDGAGALHIGHIRGIVYVPGGVRIKRDGLYGVRIVRLYMSGKKTAGASDEILKKGKGGER